MGFLSPVISVKISISRIVVVRLLSAREPGAGRPASVRVQGESFGIFVLLCCEGWRSNKSCDVARFCLHDGTQLRVQLLNLVEAPRERCDGVSDAQKRQRKGVTLVLIPLQGLSAGDGNGTRQQLRVAKRVSDPVSGQGILEIAGVTGECPSRAVALSQVAPRPTKAPQTADQ